MPGVGQPGLDRIDIDLPGPGAAAAATRLAAAIDGFCTVRRPAGLEEFTQFVNALMEPNGLLTRFVFAGADVSVRPDGGAGVHGWLRAWPESRYAEIRDEVRALVAAVPGARVEFPPEPFPAMLCSPELSEAAADHLRGRLGDDAVLVQRALFPFNGEEFALFLQRVPGAGFYLGVANAEAGINGVPHSPDFAADEEALGVGIRAMAGFLAVRSAA